MGEQWSGYHPRRPILAIDRLVATEKREDFEGSRMATDVAQELEDQLAKTKAALQGQAEEMLDLLLQFEARLQERLEAAEARIAAYRLANGEAVADAITRETYRGDHHSV